MTSYNVSEARLRTLVQKYSDAISRGEAVIGKTDGLLFIFGDQNENTLENQRGQAIIQYLLDAKTPVTNVAIIVNANSTFVLHLPGVDVSVTKLEGYSVTSTADLDSFKSSTRNLLQARRIGVALKELDIQDGQFSSNVIQFLKSSGADLVDTAAAMGELLFVKDDNAQKSVEKSAGLCSTVFRRFAYDLVKSQIAATAPSTLNALREQLCQKLMSPHTIPGLESLNTEDFSIAAGLPACIFHNARYNSKIQIDSDDLQRIGADTLQGDILTIRYGTKHRGYTAFIGRTCIVENKAPPAAKSAYEFALSVSDKVIQLLTPGKSLKDVYEETIRFAQSSNSNFASHLPKSLGFSTGLLVLEARGSISEKGSAVIQNGMCFVVRITLEGLEGDSGAYNIEIADTVIVSEGKAELRTKVYRRVEDVLFTEEEDEGDKHTRRDLSKITRQGASETEIISREAQREAELRRLLQELHAEYVAAGGKKGSKVSQEELNVYDIGRLALGELNPLNSKDLITSEGSILVDSAKKIAWFPVYGKPCPFHISTISKVETKREGGKYIFVTTFHTLQEANIGFRLNRTKAFLKELTYHSSKDVFTEVQISIQKIQQAIKNEDAHRKRNATAATGGKLSLIQNPMFLPQIKMRPTVQIGRKNQACMGNLELHENGLRFIYPGGTPIHILFENVKHIILQPAMNSVMVCYHISLKKSVELGNKATTDIQFYAEVMESSEAATGFRRTYEEELMAEEKEQARVRATNQQFMVFARRTEEKSNVKTQLPLNNFSFDGVHSKSMVTFKGSKETLWAVTDWPSFTISVADIEVASLERVFPGNSTFDLTFILKDYNKPVVTINSIPKSSLEAIKDWCLSVRLYYMETSVNPNWKVAMKDIRDDEEWDPWLQGTGWSVLNDGDEEDEEGSSEESDSTFDEEDEESSDDSSWTEDEESDITSPSSEEEESSADWDELERKAQAHDRKRRYDDDDDDRPTKRRRAAPQAPASVAAPKRQPAYGQNAAPPPRRF